VRLGKLDVIILVFIYVVSLLSLYSLIVSVQNPMLLTYDRLSNFTRAAALLLVIFGIAYVALPKEILGYLLDISSLIIIPLHYVHLVTTPRLTSIVPIPLFDILKGTTRLGSEFSIITLDFAQLGILILILRHRTYITNLLRKVIKKY